MMLTPLLLATTFQEAEQQPPQACVAEDRYYCSLCHVPVKRVKVHLQQKKHNLTPNSPEFDEVVAASMALKVGEVTIKDITTVKALVDLYHEYLLSYSGGAKGSEAAKQETSRVLRFLDELLGNEQYRPTRLRLLAGIGHVPDGLLYRMEKGLGRSKVPLKASTISVYAQSIVNFTEFLYLHPQHLKGEVTQAEILQWKLVAKNCSQTFVGKRAVDDLVRHEEMVGRFCSPQVFGRFLTSTIVQEAFVLLDSLVQQPVLCTRENFVRIRDVLMLSAAMTNARRTGELINMTVDNLLSAKSSRSDANDHIIFVRKNKVRSKYCKINFYSTLFDAAKKYVLCFGMLYLGRAGKHGRMFPHVTQDGQPVPMSTSLYNKRIKSVWASYVSQAADKDQLPSASVFSSSYIRKVWVTAVHPTGDRTRMAEVASHMTHNLATAESHYDASGQLESTSRSTDYFRKLMWADGQSTAGVAGRLDVVVHRLLS